jgi:hypothetical protein
MQKIFKDQSISKQKKRRQGVIAFDFNNDVTDTNQPMMNQSRNDATIADIDIEEGIKDLFGNE